MIDGEFFNCSWGTFSLMNQVSNAKNLKLHAVCVGGWWSADVCLTQRRLDTEMIIHIFLSCICHMVDVHIHGDS